MTISYAMDAIIRTWVPQSAGVPPTKMIASATGRGMPSSGGRKTKRRKNQKRKRNTKSWLLLTHRHQSGTKSVPNVRTQNTIAIGFIAFKTGHIVVLARLRGGVISIIVKRVIVNFIKSLN